MAESLNATDEDDAKTVERLREVLGDFFAEMLYGDKDWALSILTCSIKQQS
jgi:transcription initiation factor TFIID subunit 6